MSERGFTSNWTFTEIARNTDRSYTGSESETRQFSTVKRYRYSDQPFGSERGDNATQLEGFNGSRYVSVEAPVAETVYKFSIDQTWTLSTTQWEESGLTFNGGKVFVQEAGTTNIPDNSKVNVLYRDSDSRWVCTESTEADIAALNLPAYYADASNATATAAGQEETPNGVTLDNQKGTFANCRFFPATNWTLSTTEWEGTGQTFNGGDVFTQEAGTTNIPDNSKVNVLYRDSSDRWVAAESTQADIDSLNLLDFGSTTNAKATNTGKGTTPYAELFLNKRGTFDSTNTVPGAYFASCSGTTVNTESWFCESDIETYDTAGVEWYRQEQVWTYEGEWE